MTTKWCLKVEEKGKYHNLNSIKNLVMLLFLVKDQALQINLLRIQLLITQSSLWGINQMRIILELIEIDEVFTESSWSEIEDIQSEIITALSDEFDIIKEESDGNCMFRALSRCWFGTIL